MNFLYRAQNKKLRIIGNGHRYLRNTTICRGIGTTTLKKKQNQSKDFYKTIYKILYKIVVELPDYDVPDPANRKRNRYALLIDDED